MKSKITLKTFRRVDALQETMMRGVMPRTSAADPEPLPVRAARDVAEVGRVDGSRLVKPLMATMQEVANA